MLFVNESQTIGQILIAGTQNLTGNIVVTLLVIMIFLLCLCVLFGIELEFSAIIFLPICITLGAYYSSFMGMIIVILIYVSTIIAKNWLFR